MILTVDALETKLKRVKHKLDFDRIFATQAVYYLRMSFQWQFPNVFEHASTRYTEQVNFIEL
jgi:hypothetical protein